MDLTSPNLRLTLDALDDAIFYSLSLTSAECEAFTLSILSQQILSGPRTGMFNHGAAGREAAPRLFTGEQLYTLLAARHTLLIDSARLLTLLGLKTGAATRAFEAASQAMEARCYAGFCAVGECRHLTVAFMRCLIASTPPSGGYRLSTFFNRLVAHRDGQGKWGSFPFYYTLLMLSESESPQAAEERLYAASACAALLDRPWKDDPISRRRKTLLERTINGATHFKNALQLT